MDASNKQIGVAVYESKSFWDDCDGFFSRKAEFVVICENKSVIKCKKAIKLFLQFRYGRPKGVARLKLLAKIWMASINVAIILAVCNTALLFKWEIISDSLPDNQLLHLKPPM